jgi:hypothetical protein
VAKNRTAVDSLHNKLNSYFNTKQNPNWKAIVEAIGESDQDVANLIEEVRKQFFISSAYRPYLDRLAANYKVSRPKVVGMDDVTLRKYIPILAYQPKQVKTIIDQLLDVFFFRESTTSFAETTEYGPFVMKDGWELNYTIDGFREESIIFSSLDFENVNEATTLEIVAAINRQAKYSFAVVFNDKITNRDYIRLFTNTIGSKGSVEVTGGRANITLKFLGNIAGAGSGDDTEWNITKIGDTVRFTYEQVGAGPNLFLVEVGDNVIVDIPNNSGTFTITNINVQESYFEFQNLLGTEMIFNHGLNTGYYVRFIKPQRSVVYTRNNRSIVWEVNPGEIVIEMPATPPVVRRQLKGSAHLNGPISEMVSRSSDSSLIVEDAEDWPQSGQFVIKSLEQIKNKIITPTIESLITTQNIDTNFDIKYKRFTYTNKVKVSNGYLLSGITPNLPVAAGVIERSIESISSNARSLLTIRTSLPHYIEYAGSVRVYDVPSPGTSMNGVFNIKEVIDDYTFTCQSAAGQVSEINAGSVRLERKGLANSGSAIYLVSGIANSGIFGPYMYDTGAPFVVSSYVGKTNQELKAGNIALNLAIKTPNNIPYEEGYLIFDYGKNTQEGPVRYLYKSSDSSLALDPAYVFKYDHGVDSTITAIRRKGAHVLSGLGKEYSFYVSDPAAARQILQDLITQVKSVGLFLDYLIRYPIVYYSQFDTYGQTTQNNDLLGL